MSQEKIIVILILGINGLRHSDKIILCSTGMGGLSWGVVVTPCSLSIVLCRHSHLYINYSFASLSINVLVLETIFFPFIILSFPFVGLDKDWENLCRAFPKEGCTERYT